MLGRGDIGIAGRYQQRGIPDRHLQATRKVHASLKPHGALILTIPLGKDQVFAPWHRIYGVERLPRLLEGFLVENEHFFLKEAG